MTRAKWIALGGVPLAACLAMAVALGVGDYEARVERVQPALSVQQAAASDASRSPSQSVNDKPGAPAATAR